VMGMADAAGAVSNTEGMLLSVFIWNGQGGRRGQPRRCSFLARPQSVVTASGLRRYYTPPGEGGSLAFGANLPGLAVFQDSMSFSLVGNAMDVLWDIVVSIGHGIELVLVYVETHHWIFGFLVIGYIFYLHDRALHARFDALDKRIDEIRKRLAVEY